MTRNNDEGADHQGAGRGGCEGEREEALVAGLTALVALTARHSATHPDARMLSATSPVKYTEGAPLQFVYKRECVSLVTRSHTGSRQRRRTHWRLCALSVGAAGSASWCSKCRRAAAHSQLPTMAIQDMHARASRSATLHTPTKRAAHTRPAHSPADASLNKLAPRLTSSPAPAPAPPRRRRSPAPLCPSTS